MGVRPVSTKARNRRRVLRLVVAENAVVIAVGMNIGFEFRWDGWEKEAVKGDMGRDGG